MKCISKASVFLATVLGLNCAAHAGMYVAPTPACLSNPVSIPCDSLAWDLGFDGFAVEGMNDDRWYASAISDVTNASDPVNLPEYFADNDYEWGFRVEGSLHYKQGRDIVINWIHSKENDSEVLPGLFSHRNYVANDALTLALATHYKFDAGNLEFGQHLDVGPDVNMRFHYGLHYVNIEHHTGVTLTNLRTTAGVVTVATAADTRVLMSDFDGLGFRAGLDSSYLLGSGFGLVGKMAVGFIVGDLDSSRTDRVNTISGAGLVTGIVTTTFPTVSERVLIPELDGKLGVSFTFSLLNAAFMLQGGWQWNTYYNVVRNRFATTPATGVVSSGVMQGSSNFGLQGPYGSIKVVF